MLLALAIYGTRAANRVIIITTKRYGNRITVEVESFAGVSLENSKMAQTQTAHSIQRLETTTFLKIKLSIQIGLMLLREQVSILKIIYLFLDHRKILNIFLFINYEEKAVLNGLDFNRTTFRNNNEYKFLRK
jgi:hypothetical protein